MSSLSEIVMVSSSIAFALVFAGYAFVIHKKMRLSPSPSPSSPSAVSDNSAEVVAAV